MIKKAKSIIQFSKDKGLIHMFALNILIFFLHLLIQTVFITYLNPTDLGRVKIIESFLNIITLIIVFGLNTSILKLCSERIKDNLKLKYLGISIKVSLIIFIITYIASLVFNYYNLISPDIFIDNKITLIVIIALPIAMRSLISTYLKANQKIKVYTKIEFINKIINVILIVLLIINKNIEGYIFALIISNYSQLLIYGIIFRKNIKDIIEVKFNKNKIKKIIDISKHSIFANFLGLLMSSLDIILINYIIINKELIGYYAFAQIIISFIRILQLSINEVIAPNLINLNKNKIEFYNLFKKYKYSTYLLNTLITLFCYFIIPIFIKLVFKMKYLESINIFKILILGFYFWSILSPNGIALLATGNIKVNNQIYFTTIIINFILNIIFINKFGIIGAAYATSISYFISAILSTIISPKKIKKYFEIN